MELDQCDVIGGGSYCCCIMLPTPVTVKCFMSVLGVIND